MTSAESGRRVSCPGFGSLSVTHVSVRNTHLEDAASALEEVRVQDMFCVMCVSKVGLCCGLAWRWAKPELWFLSCLWFWRRWASILWPLVSPILTSLFSLAKVYLLGLNSLLITTWKEEWQVAVARMLLGSSGPTSPFIYHHVLPDVSPLSVLWISSYSDAQIELIKILSSWHSLIVGAIKAYLIYSTVCSDFTLHLPQNQLLARLHPHLYHKIVIASPWIALLLTSV
jgi:hypothetical protein